MRIQIRNTTRSERFTCITPCFMFVSTRTITFGLVFDVPDVFLAQDFVRLSTSISKPSNSGSRGRHVAQVWSDNVACLSLWRPSMGLLICLIIYLKKRRKERKVEKNTKRSTIRTSWKVNLTLRYFYNYPLSDLTPRPRPSVKNAAERRKKTEKIKKRKKKKKLFTTFGILSTTTCDFVIL